MVDLESIYRRALADCDPEHIVRRSVDESMPQNVVAIGKCAAKMLAGVDFDRALCVIPRGYPRPDSEPSSRLGMTFGGHPDIDDDSFRAGEELLRFVDQCDDVLFLISGGGSACVESPLAPFTRDEIIAVNRALVRSRLPIGDVNIVRKHLSAIKGGRLAARVHGRSVTLVYSDVSAGAISDVASGPTVADSSASADAARILERLGDSFPTVIEKLSRAPETIKRLDNASARIIADNTTLTSSAARFLDHAVVVDHQIESSVEEAAEELADRAAKLRGGEVLIAGGEPTVARRGNGKGGRCCELAVRFAMRCNAPALFGSSDGVDGSSGIAAIVIDGFRGLNPAAAQRQELGELLASSDSLAAAKLVGRAVMIPPTGNNLRDLFLVSGI